MIEIQEIKNVTTEDIVNLLLGEKEQPFEVYVPKSTQLCFSSNEDIANDYAMLAFAGQKLSEVADEFSYDYVSPTNHDSVLFEIKTDDIKQLAETILFISYGYNNDPEDEEIYYLDEVYDFIDKVKTGDTIPVCPDFLNDYHEYYEQADNDEDSENNDD
jgi:hypothetical protein